MKRLSRPPSLSSNGEEENESHLSDLVQQLEASSVKDLRVAHLNVCSIKNKIDELRCLQLLCRFEVIAITETHLDIKQCEMKRCKLKAWNYYGSTVRVAKEVDACYIIMNTSKQRLIEQSLEKAWLKSSCIILLGDFNCDFSTREDWNGNSAQLRSIFEMFNMENVIKTATRITLTSRTLIDLIVTTRKDSVGITGVFPLGISNHSLVYSTLRLKNKRPSPKWGTI